MKDAVINKLTNQQDIYRGCVFARAALATCALRARSMVACVRGGYGSSG